MQFEKIGLQHIKIINDAVSAVGWSSCQLSAAALFCYADKYSTEICLQGGNIFIKQRRVLEESSEAVACYFLPIPQAAAQAASLDTALSELKQWHRQNETGSFIIWGVADDMLDFADDALHRANMSALPPERDWAEYIHTPENLIDMRGKKFHAKKNAVNQFIRLNSDFYYVPLSREILDEAASFQERLLKGVKKFATDERGVHALCVENTAVMRGLGNFEALGLKGGILRVNGEIGAFAFGGEINREAFGIMFEKGLRSYNGIFQVMEQEMLKSSVSGYKFINREEDLGEPGLRAAKERLRPDRLMFKRRFEIL